jgi:hypothetical protein
VLDPLRLELERLGQIVSWNTTERDTETGLYRIGFDWEYVGKLTWTPPPAGNVDR